jgi:hypothetical protein
MDVTVMEGLRQCAAAVEVSERLLRDVKAVYAPVMRPQSAYFMPDGELKELHDAIYNADAGGASEVATELRALALRILWLGSGLADCVWNANIGEVADG